MIFTDENGNKYEAVVHPDFGVGYLIKPIKEAEKLAYYAVSVHSAELGHVPFATNFEFNRAQAEAVSEAIKALLVMVNSDKRLDLANYILAANNARKAVQEEV